MPQMNGYELCRAVKQLEETSSVPVLLLAGTFEAFDEEEAKSVGANEFITKPFESGELIEKVKALIGDMPATSPAVAAPAADGASVAADPEVMPEAVPQQVPDIPAQPPASEVSEPDIWDILSDTGDEVQAQATEGGAPAPGFGPIETAGVVDVGSFDVALGRPESPPTAPQPLSTAPPESVQTPGALEDAPAPQVQPAPAAPSAADQVQDVEERSRVENMEKDFFGFETGAVEEVPIADFLDDAVEEVTFEMEQPQAVPEVDAQEASFVIPEPAGDQGVVTGETIAPDFIAPDSPPPSPFAEASPSTVDMDEMTEGKPETVPVPSVIEGSEPASAPASPTEPSIEIATQPVPEPPLELPVDITSELPEEFSPEPVVPKIEIPTGPGPEPTMDAPVVPVPEASTVVPSPAAVNIPDDAAIRKVVEERVEKIAWEVVPEMAEVIIREIIQKIKDGS
jgi:hypothetical protein